MAIFRQPCALLPVRSTLRHTDSNGTPPMSMREITLVGPSGEKRPATVSCDERHCNEKGYSRRECTIQLRADGFDLQSAAWDFFGAFCGIRDQLAVNGFYPLCYGASRCVYPSGLLRDMALGLEAYRMQIGRAVRAEDAVNIFDTGPDVELQRLPRSGHSSRHISSQDLNS